MVEENIQSLGLSNEYKDTNSEIGKWLRHTFGRFLMRGNDRPDNELLTKYSDYLVDNYIGDDCKYPPSLWAALSA
ncbi:Uncharacterized protein FWK35_00035059, partial [Aphis craccivora]